MAKTKPSKNMTSAEVTRAMLRPALHIEVREKQNGSWAVFYPDPGFIPCPPVCDIKRNNRTHKCDFDQPWIETNYKPVDYQDALHWANYLADGGEVKVVAYVPLSERRKKKTEDKA